MRLRLPSNYVTNQSKIFSLNEAKHRTHFQQTHEGMSNKLAGRMLFQTRHM